MFIEKYISASGWFSDGLKRRGGDRKHTSFWNDSWVESGIRLRDVCPRLFSLDVDKNCVVANRIEEIDQRWLWR